MTAEILVSSAHESASMGLHFKHQRALSKTSPVIYLIHGRAGSYDHMWAFRRCVPSGWTIVAPQAPLSDSVGGWSWWNVPRTDEFQTEVEASYHLIDTFISNYEDRERLNPSVRIACGFSQGAAMLSVLLQRAPSRVKGVGLLAGFVLPVDVSADVSPTAQVFVAHGTKDEIVSIEDSRKGQARLESFGFNVIRVEDDVGHKVGVQGIRSLGEWLTHFNTGG